MKNFFFAFTLLFAFSGNIQAQTEPSMDNIQEQMQMMQQQMMQMLGLDSSDMAFEMPFDGGIIDTSFFFQTDSLFSGDGFGGMFRMQPFGFDSEGDMEMGDIMKSFGDIMQMFEGFDGSDGFSTMPPSDDGDMAEDEDYILPEDRLRQEENGETPSKKTKKKRKTVKI